MKTQMKTAFCAGMGLACALFLWRCTSDALVPDAPDQAPRKVVLEAVIDRTPVTKTLSDGIRTEWQTGDQISVYAYGTPGSEEEFSHTCFTHTGAAGSVAYFEGNPPWDLQDKHLLAVYPYKRKNYAPPVYNAYSYVIIPPVKEQWQIGYENVDFDDILVAWLRQENTETQLRFKHAWALIELRMTSQVPGVKVDSVVLSGPPDSITVDIEMVLPSLYWSRNVVAANSSMRVRKLTLVVWDSPDLAPETYYPLQMFVTPGDNVDLKMEVYLSGSVHTVISKEWKKETLFMNGTRNITYMDYAGPPSS